MGVDFAALVADIIIPFSYKCDFINFWSATTFCKQIDLLTLNNCAYTTTTTRIREPQRVMLDLSIKVLKMLWVMMVSDLWASSTININSILIVAVYLFHLLNGDWDGWWDYTKEDIMCWAVCSYTTCRDCSKTAAHNMGSVSWWVPQKFVGPL